MSHACWSERIPVGSGPCSTAGVTTSPPTASITKPGPTALEAVDGLRPPANRRSTGPEHSSRTLVTRLSPSIFGSKAIEAPSSSASSRRARIGSTAMICDAPLIRAPCIALNPHGPHPSTATSEPGSTGAMPKTVPSPNAPAHRYTVPLVGDHQLAQAALVVVLDHLYPVWQRPDREQGIARAGEHLAPVRSAAQTRVALPAVRRIRHHHAVAHLHAPNARADGFHDANSPVAWNSRHRIRIDLVDDRVVDLAGLGPHHYAVRIQLVHPDRFDRAPCRTNHERTKLTSCLRPCLNRRRLGRRRPTGSQERSRATANGHRGCMRDDASARNAPA